MEQFRAKGKIRKNEIRRYEIVEIDEKSLISIRTQMKLIQAELEKLAETVLKAFSKNEAAGADLPIVPSVVIVDQKAAAEAIALARSALI